ncbi:MAG: hypothetical protein ACJ76U_02395 [Gaiellaceae bacterium]
MTDSSTSRRGAALAAGALVAAVALALVLTATASASAPVITTTTFTVPAPDPNEVNFGCAPYGYGFDVLSSFTVTRHSILFFDEAGNLKKEIRHVQFKGTLYRSSDLSQTIPYAGNWTLTIDVAAGTLTNTGLARYSHPNGSGMVALDAGKTVIDLATFAAVVDTAQLGADWERGVCSYLAA